MFQRGCNVHHNTQTCIKACLTGVQIPARPFLAIFPPSSSSLSRQKGGSQETGLQTSCLAWAASPSSFPHLCFPLPSRIGFPLSSGPGLSSPPPCTPLAAAASPSARPSRKAQARARPALAAPRYLWAGAPRIRSRPGLGAAAARRAGAGAASGRGPEAAS